MKRHHQDEVTRFTVVQYVPDPLSGERINLGIVAIGRDRLATQFVSAWDRVDCFAAGRNTEFLRDFVRIFEDADPAQLGIGPLSPVESLTTEALVQLAGKWKNSIQFTPLAASLKTPEGVVETLAPRFLRVSPARVPQQPARTRVTARNIAVQEVRLAAEMNAPGLNLAVRRSVELSGYLEGHQFDAVAENGRPLLAVQGISFEVNDDDDLRRMIDAIAFAMLDVRREHDLVSLGVLALRQPEHEERESFLRAVKVFEGVGAHVLTEHGLRDWAGRLLNAYAAGGVPTSPPQAQLALPLSV